MSEGYQIRDERAAHFLTLTVVDWVDLFTRKSLRDILIDSLNHCIDKKGALVYGFVVMSNHMHLILQSNTGNLTGLIRDFKKWTAVKLLEAVQQEPESRRDWLLHRFAWHAAQHITNKHFQVWRNDNHPEELYSEAFFLQKLNYIHQNPVRAGWVELEEEYLYSSARHYYGKQCLIPIAPWPF